MAIDRRTDRERSEQFRLLVETVREYAIFMLDPEGNVCSWNAGAELIKGYAAHETIGKHFGVAPEHRMKVFDRFYQAHARRSGMGLGLYISRQIVEMHGGTIYAEFPSDDGTRFVVSVPLAA